MLRGLQLLQTCAVKTKGFICADLGAHISTCSCMQAFAAMKRYTSERKHMKALVGGALNRLKHGVLLSAFNAMHLHANMMQSARTKLGKVLSMWTRKSLNAAFIAWREAAKIEGEFKHQARPMHVRHSCECMFMANVHIQSNDAMSILQPVPLLERANACMQRPYGRVAFCISRWQNLF